MLVHVPFYIVSRFGISALVLASLAVTAQQPVSRPAVSPTTPQRGTQSVPSNYFPERVDWQHKKHDEVGMDAALVAEAVKVSIDRENPAPKSFR